MSQYGSTNIFLVFNLLSFLSFIYLIFRVLSVIVLLRLKSIVCICFVVISLMLPLRCSSVQLHNCLSDCLSFTGSSFAYLFVVSVPNLVRFSWYSYLFCLVTLFNSVAYTIEFHLLHLRYTAFR